MKSFILLVSLSTLSFGRSIVSNVGTLQPGKYVITFKRLEGCSPRSFALGSTLGRGIIPEIQLYLADMNEKDVIRPAVCLQGASTAEIYLELSTTTNVMLINDSNLSDLNSKGFKVSAIHEVEFLN